MLKWIELNRSMEKASKQYLDLVFQFETFAKSVESKSTLLESNFKDIKTSLHLEQGFFTITFAQQTLHFVFSSIAKSTVSGVSGVNGIEGNISCYLEREFTKRKYIKIGNFTFSDTGETNLYEPTEGDVISLQYELHSAHLIYHFIHESLSAELIEPIYFP